MLEEPPLKDHPHVKDTLKTMDNNNDHNGHNNYDKSPKPTFRPRKSGETDVTALL